MKQEEKKFLAN